MKTILLRAYREDDGLLSFEWVLLITLLTIGIVGGLAAARDAVIDELGDAAQAMLALDQTFDVDYPLFVELVHEGSDPSDDPSGASNSGFLDDHFFEDCGRFELEGQGSVDDSDG